MKTRHIADPLAAIRSTLGKKAKIDLSSYSPAFFKRRTDLRMRFAGISEYDEYLSYIISNDSEYKHLLDSLSINVTRFFRNGHVWGKIKNEIIPKIVSKSKSYKPIKIWSAGCASGEEAYTIAILFKEYSNRLFQVYATDRNPKAIEIAKKGIYKKELFEEFPANLFKKYVEPTADNNWQIKKEDLKHNIKFSVGDIMSPPDENFDIILCRNVLIYFDSEIKEKYYKKFYNSLKPEGFFLLGLDEFMVGGFSKQSFVHILLDQRIYQKK